MLKFSVLTSPCPSRDDCASSNCGNGSERPAGRGSRRGANQRHAALIGPRSDWVPTTLKSFQRTSPPPSGIRIRRLLRSVLQFSLTNYPVVGLSTLGTSVYRLRLAGNGVTAKSSPAGFEPAVDDLLRICETKSPYLQTDRYTIIHVRRPTLIQTSCLRGSSDIGNPSGIACPLVQREILLVQVEVNSQFPEGKDPEPQLIAKALRPTLLFSPPIVNYQL